MGGRSSSRNSTSTTTAITDRRKAVADKGVLAEVGSNVRTASGDGSILADTLDASVTYSLDANTVEQALGALSAVTERAQRSADAATATAAKSSADALTAALETKAGNTSTAVWLVLAAGAAIWAGSR